jgi:hypothetical protein
MNTTDKIIEIFKKKKIQFEPGLSGEEIHEIEMRFQFRFPPDLRLLFQTLLPVSEHFYHWRQALVDVKTAEHIEKMFDWPRHGILFDVEHSNFWVHRELPDVPAWGPKPETLAMQLETASKHVSSYVKLIPVYSHRFLPEMPFEEGNPVFSVYQTDIIYYGDSLLNYFHNEFEQGNEYTENIKHIPFWSDCCLGVFDEMKN